MLDLPSNVKHHTGNTLPVAPFLALALFDSKPDNTEENGTYIFITSAIRYLFYGVELAFSRGDIVTILETNGSGIL